MFSIPFVVQVLEIWWHRASLLGLITFQVVNNHIGTEVTILHNLGGDKMNLSGWGWVAGIFL